MHVLTPGHAVQLIVQNEAGCEVPTAAVDGGLSLAAPRYFSPESPGLHTLRVRAGGRDLRVPPVHVQVYPEQRDVRRCPRLSVVPPLAPPAAPLPPQCSTSVNRPADADAVAFTQEHRSQCISVAVLMPLIRHRRQLRARP